MDEAPHKIMEIRRCTDADLHDRLLDGRRLTLDEIENSISSDIEESSATLQYCNIDSSLMATCFGLSIMDYRLLVRTIEIEASCSVQNCVDSWHA